MMRVIFEYRCQRCGKIINHEHTPPFYGHDNVMGLIMGILLEDTYVIKRFICHHGCRKRFIKGVGIANLVGYHVKDKAENKWVDIGPASPPTPPLE